MERDISTTANYEHDFQSNYVLQEKIFGKVYSVSGKIQ